MIKTTTKGLPPTTDRIFRLASHWFDKFLADPEVQKAIRNTDFKYTNLSGTHILSDLLSIRKVEIVGYRSFWRKSAQMGKTLGSDRYGVNLRKPWYHLGVSIAGRLHGHECSHLAGYGHKATGRIGRWFGNFKTAAKMQSVPYRIGEMFRVWIVHREQSARG